MPQVNIATSVAPAEFAAGTELGQMRFRLEGPTVLQRYTMFSDMPLPPVVTFPNVAVGTYTLSIQRQALTGAMVGTPYTAQVVVAAPAPPPPPPLVVGDAPVGAEVTVG